MTLAAINLLALGAGVAFGPVYGAGGRIRTWALRIVFLAAVALEFAHLPSLAWFFVLWMSFGIGGRIRRRLANRTPAPLNEDDPAAAAYGAGAATLRRGGLRSYDRPGD